MFFRRKYVFESQKTKAFRQGLNALLLAVLFMALYSVVCATFVFTAESETQEAAAAYYKRPPDLIVVFTGDVGRIPYALKKAHEYKQSHILISGVGGGNTVTSLVSTDAATADLMQMENFDIGLLEIDYLARNTLENVIETLRYLRKNSGMKNILVISHDYHIVRIMTLFNVIRSDQDPYVVHYAALKSDYSNWRNLKILYKEVFKLARNMVMLALWDDEIPRS